MKVLNLVRKDNFYVELAESVLRESSLHETVEDQKEKDASCAVRSQTLKVRSTAHGECLVEMKTSSISP